MDNTEEKGFVLMREFNKDDWRNFSGAAKFKGDKQPIAGKILLTNWFLEDFEELSKMDIQTNDGKKGEFEIVADADMILITGIYIRMVLYIEFKTHKPQDIAMSLCSYIIEHCRTVNELSMFGFNPEIIDETFNMTLSNFTEMNKEWICTNCHSNKVYSYELSQLNVKSLTEFDGTEEHYCDNCKQYGIDVSK